MSWLKEKEYSYISSKEDAISVLSVVTCIEKRSKGERC